MNKWFMRLRLMSCVELGQKIENSMENLTHLDIRIMAHMCLSQGI